MFRFGFALICSNTVGWNTDLGIGNCVGLFVVEDDKVGDGKNKDGGISFVGKDA